MAEKDRNILIGKDRKEKAERKPRKEPEKETNILATHTVESGETLSHIALKYYKHATPPYWKLLLEHNNDLLEGNERNLRTGMTLEIPELPDALKD